MQQNFQSLAYFLPELIIILSILFVIISDLVPSIKQYSFHLSLTGIFLASIMLLIVGCSNSYIFNIYIYRL